MNDFVMPRQATVLGLGGFGGNLAVVRYLLQQGVHVKLTDRRPVEDFAGLGVHDVLDRCECFFGDHSEAAFTGSQMLVVTAAIRPDNSIVQSCRQQGLAITSEIELFLSRCPARVVAVTGTNGKSSTATLIAGALRAQENIIGGNTWLGGNIGQSLLPQLDLISQGDVVVLELSSFQLMQLRGMRFAPDVAVFTNFTPNHLDWHSSLEEYRAAKQSLLDFQTSDQFAVLPEDGEADWRARGNVLRHGIADFGEDGVFLSEGNVVVRVKDFEDAVRWAPPPAWRSVHQQRNLAAALATVQSVGADVENALSAIKDISSLPHRMQPVGNAAGLLFVNDSNSTTPESTIAGLKAVAQPVVLIAGGSDKGLDLSSLAQVASDVCRGVVLIGETAHSFQKLMGRISDGPPVVCAESLSQAVAQAVELASPGGMVLLSPGCASFGMFRDYRDRGDQFCQLVREVSDSQ